MQFCYCKATRQGNVFICNCLATMPENLAAQCLVQDLLLSPAVCDLINSIQPDALAHDDSESSDHHESLQHIPSEVMQLTTQNLLEECQQGTCTSTDTTLAFKGLSDQSPAHLQVHRCVLCAQLLRALRPLSSLALSQVHPSFPLSLLSGPVFYHLDTSQL